MHHIAKLFRYGDVILSRCPDSWQEFFDLTDRLEIPADFLLHRRDTSPQERKRSL